MSGQSTRGTGGKPSPRLRHALPVTRRDAPDGSAAPLVTCPRRGDSVAMRECGQCEHCLGVIVNVTGIGTLLKCGWGAQTPAAAGQSATFAAVDSSDGPSVGELMTPSSGVARPDTTVEVVAEHLLQHGIDAVAVQDAHGEAVGVVCTGDLLRKYLDDGDTGEILPEAASIAQAGVSLHPVHAGQSCVADVMSRPVLGLTADATVARAAALMAYEGVHQLIVFQDDGSIAGVLSSLDILRWLAGRAGFVVPHRRRGG